MTCCEDDDYDDDDEDDDDVSNPKSIKLNILMPVNNQCQCTVFSVHNNQQFTLILRDMCEYVELGCMFQRTGLNRVCVYCRRTYTKYTKAVTLNFYTSNINIFLKYLKQELK